MLQAEAAGGGGVQIDELLRLLHPPQGHATLHQLPVGGLDLWQGLTQGGKVQELVVELGGGVAEFCMAEQRCMVALQPFAQCLQLVMRI